MHSLIPATGVSVASRVKQEARVDRFKLAACGLVGAVVLSGCSAGQVSQTAVQEAAVNGTSANIGEVAVRNVHLRANQTTDYVQPGREVELLFLASNGSPDVNDKLVSITSDIGTVTLTGDTSLPANGALVVGSPDGQTTALESVEAADGRGGDGPAVQADLQRLDVQLHVQVREGWRGHCPRADLGR